MALNAARRNGRSRKEGGSGVGAGCTVRVRKGGVIETIFVAWGDDSGGIERHRRSCVDRTGSHKRSFLVDAGTYIGHPTTWVRRREVVVVVGSKRGGRDVPCLRPRRERSRQADASVARRRLDQGGEKKY